MANREQSILDELSGKSEIFDSRFEHDFSEQGSQPERAQLLDEVTQWMRACAQHGRFLPPGSADRRAFRSLLQGWSFRLREQGHYVRDIDELADFDPNAGIVLSVDCPYPGLEPYTQSQRGVFFGREKLAARCVAHLEQPGNRILLISGASGSGKSSLALAGVLPQLADLHAEAWLLAPRFTPSTSPMGELAQAIAQTIGRPDQAGELEGNLTRNPGEALHQVAMLCRHKPLMLFIDQFEELLTMCREDSEQRTFARVLCALSDPAVVLNEFSCRILLTLRSDYRYPFETRDTLSDLHRRLFGEENGNYVDLSGIGFDDIKRAIKGPADEVGLRFIPANLIDQLASETHGLSNGLPLLQFALWRLWDTRPRNEAGEKLDMVTAEMVRRLPDVERALGTVAERVFNKLGELEQQVCERMLLELVVLDENFEEPLRRRRLEAELRGVLETRFPSGRVPDVIERFVSKGLLRRFGKGADARIEVAHEALLRRWQHIADRLSGGEVKERLLRVRQIGREASDWVAGGRSTDLVKLKGEPLLRAIEYGSEGWLAGTEVTDYVDACEDQEKEQKLKDEQAREQEQREKLLAKKFTRLAVRSAVLLAILVLFAGYSWFRAEQAVEARRAGELAALAENPTKSTPEQSILLALEAYAIQRDSDTEAVIRAVRDRFSFTRTLRGHKGPVVLARFSLDGQTILTASEDHTVRLWSAEDGQQLHELRHDGPVSSAQFSPDGQTVVTTSSNDKALLWRVTDGQLLRELPHADEVSGAQFSPDGKTVVTYGGDKTVRLWVVTTGELLRELPHDALVMRARVSPDGRTIVTTSADNKARLWFVNSDRQPYVLSHRAELTSEQFSPDGQTVLTTSIDGEARLWSVASGQPLRALPHDASVTNAQFSPDSRTVLTTSGEKTARLWAVAQNGQPQVLEGHEGRVTSAQFSRDGRTVLTTSADKTARLWSVESGKQLHQLSHDASVASAQFSPDGQLVVTTMADNAARLWAVAGGRLLRELRGHEDQVSGAQFSPDGQRIVTYGKDKTARLWSVASDRELQIFTVPDKAVLSAHSPDGRTVLTTSSDDTARLWSVANGKELQMLRGHQDQVTGAQFSRDGQRIVTYGKDKTARLWSMTSDQQLQALTHDDDVSGAQFSPDGQTVLTRSWKTAWLWTVASGQVQQVLRHDAPVTSAQFSPDGQTVITTSADKTPLLWSAANGQVAGKLVGHDALVTSALFSPDGQTLITTSADKTARLWTAANGKEQRVLRHDAPVTGAEFSADGKAVITVSVDNAVRLWTVTSDQVQQVLRHDAPVTSAQFSPDGRTVLTTSLDKAARLWSVASGQTLQALPHDLPVTSARFTNGQTVFTTSEDNTARVWSCHACRPIDEVVRSLCTSVGRDFTEKEQEDFPLEGRPLMKLWRQSPSNCSR